MGSYSVTTGKVKVRLCPETERIVEELRTLADDMDERDVICSSISKQHEAGVIEVEVNICGHTSASHASEIDDKVRELGPYAIEAARFDTEWECRSDRFFVGSSEQVATAESADALEHIKQWAPRLQAEDLHAATRYLMQFVQAPDRNAQPNRKRDSENAKSNAV